MAVTIDRSGTDKWRWTCPRGHTDWTLRGGQIYCRSCPHSKIAGGVHYETIHDRRENTTLSAAEVRVG